MDSRFRVALIAATPNPQQCVYAGMHQDYSEGFVAADASTWPDETKAGEICVKRLLAGERGHYGPLEHAQIVLNVGWFLTNGKDGGSALKNGDSKCPSKW